MKKIILSIISVLVLLSTTQAQTNAMDFTMNDCNGNMHNLFTDLDNGNVVILEYFMLNCASCVNAADEIDPMHNNLNTAYNGNVKYYTFGFSNSYSCTNIKNWVTNNGFNAVPFDSGATQVAYYGGMGMPTVVVVGGTDHKVLYSTVGYSAGDTAAIATAIKGFFNAASVNKLSILKPTVSFFPNPAKDILQVNYEVTTSSDIRIEVMNGLGQLTISHVIGKQNIGKYMYAIGTTELAAGVYTLNVYFNDQVLSNKFSVQHK